MKKKILLFAALACCLMLCACAGIDVSDASQPDSAPVPASSASAASESDPALAPGVVTLLPELEYDEIRPVVDFTSPYPYTACGFDGSEPVYYTMSQDGLWGLMREDFTVVLECLAPKPVTRCSLGEWDWLEVYSGQFDAVSRQLAQTGDGTLHAGHGAGSASFYWNVDTAEAGYLHLNEGFGTPRSLSDDDFARYGDWLPAKRTHLQRSELTGLDTQTTLDNPPLYIFVGLVDGVPTPLTQDAYEGAGWFREGLGSVWRDGKIAYLNADGELATDFIYDGVWAEQSNSQSVLDEATGTYVNMEVPGTGYPLQNGYALVRQNGLWGWIDASGAQVVPCQYEAACPMPDGRALVRQDGVWSIRDPAQIAA